MLRRSKRIQGKAHVAAVIKEGAKKISPFFVLKSISSEGQTQSRYAVVVSKKLLKRAVDRNKKRRQIYECCKMFEQNGHVPNAKPSDIVVLVRHAALELDFPQLKKQIQELLSQLI